MRKANRAITDFDEIKALIDSCDTIRLGFVDGDEAYIVPLSFGFEAENGEFTFYVHGAKAGRRHTLAKKAAAFASRPMCAQALSSLSRARRQPTIKAS